MKDITPKETLDQKIGISQGLWDIFLPWGVGACLALTSQLAAPAVQRMIEEGSHEKLTYDIAYIISFLIFLFWFSRLVRKRFKARTKEMRVTDNPNHCPTLVIFLSTAFNECPCELEKMGIASLKTDLQKIVDYKEDMHEKQKRPTNWAWEMPLRSIHYHIKDINNPLLKEIIIVCSPESLDQLAKFKKLLDGYLNSTAIEIKSLLKTNAGTTDLNLYNANIQDLNGINFEDFDELSAHLYKAINQLSKQGKQPKDIMIDFTSGQKVTSIVAAALTFNSEINAQYISTKTLEVKGYDIVYGTRRIPDFG